MNGFKDGFATVANPALEADSHERTDSPLDSPAGFGTSGRTSNLLVSLGPVPSPYSVLSMAITPVEAYWGSVGHIYTVPEEINSFVCCMHNNVHEHQENLPAHICAYVLK